MEFRHACRRFRVDLAVSEDEVAFIIEAGRLSPSSLGLEPWHFVVVRDPGVKAQVQAAAGGQEHVGHNAVLIAVLAKKSDLVPESDYVKSIFRRLGQEQEADLGAAFAALSKETDIVSWAVTQCHIAAANMMTAAAYCEIDSCPVGNFDNDRVLTALGLEKDRFEVALLIPFGHRAHPAPARLRQPLNAIVEYR